MKTTNLTDVTDLSEAALDVFLSVKAGDDCVDVDHLTEGDRRAVCKALGIKAPTYWLASLPYAAPRSSGPRLADYEGAILSEQDEGLGI